MPTGVTSDAINAELLLRLHHEGARLLLAEDNAINRRVALELLRGVGLIAETAADGREALQKAQAQAYDLTLTDIQMPYMDGLEATRAIRAWPGRETTPILAMTADVFEEDRRACMDAGMDDFVAKPVEPDLLYQTLLKWLPAHATPPLSRLPGPNPTALDQMQTEGQTDKAIQSAMDALACVPGLDVARGLAALRGNAEKYLDLIGSFVELHIDDMQHLTDALALSDLTKARRLVHSLKGTAGTLGALTLQNTAARMESTLRARDGTLPGVGQTAFDMEAFTREMMMLAAALPNPPAPVPTEKVKPQDSERLGLVLKELETLLSHSDTQAIALFEAHAESMGAAGGRPARRSPARSVILNLKRP